jgi:thiamine pyrophosphate-dependent acetolactate synthase large subunit-like protein
VTTSGVIELLLSHLTNELVVSANGYISRRLFNCHDRNTNFYMLGSMGLASSIALGVALAQPHRKVIVIDGDGNVLMSLGALTMIGGCRPTNLIHIAIDNEQYATTGGQRSLSAKVDLVQLALAAGYDSSSLSVSASEFCSSVHNALRRHGTTFIVAKVAPDTGVPPRVDRSPKSIAERSKGACANSDLV